MRRSYILILLLVAVLVVGGVFYLEYHHRQELSKVQNACIILISKQEMKLRLIDYKGQEIFCAPVATGKNVGDKRKQGDMRTPEGVFQVSDIQRWCLWRLLHTFACTGAQGDRYSWDPPSRKYRYEGVRRLYPDV